MKTLHKVILFGFLFFFINSFSQEVDVSTFINKTYIIQSVPNGNYQYISFPKPNFIKKRGGFANYDDLVGKKVTIFKIVKEKKSGTVVSIKLEDGNKFFGVYPSIDANLQKAIEKGELLEVN
ncbi:dihydroorotase [Flavobacterium jejuense]|uniref:Dihydroorotase n=1 Tax=Flavobacterium jejuense TaxID=1544455 RepID=A0ABX0IQT1_9FLAO|nr:dihydroorotase [Flavobacterium jejuense]NHN25420.1 dihydroorotase [Flavobacterium jejuense]